jgi:NAD(P)-dependent dehydrogenase (short-subunit alcohol dehydrogenase family)
MVARFADLTGDRNALHLDEEFARKSRFRERVVHGLLPFSFLVALEEAFPEASVSFSAFAVRFVSPVWIGVPVRLAAEASAGPGGTMTFQADWTAADGETLIQASGTFRLGTPEIVTGGNGGSCLLSDRISENAYSIDELDGKSESLRFRLDPGVLTRYQTLLFRPALGRDNYGFCPNLAACLLLSPLVGMRLPGRYATFSSFKASFADSLSLATPCSVSGVIEQVSSASESVSMSASFVHAGEQTGTAHLKVMVNPPPREMIGCEAIRERYLDTGVRGKVAVIIGASRGIGETAAKLFAMHGARTVVHYYRGRGDAAAIVEEIRNAGGTAVALGCDIRDEGQVTRFFAEVLEAYGRIDILINNAIKDFRPRPFLKLQWGDYLDELEVSLKGLHNCCREAVPIFKRQGGGKIVNLSSVLAEVPVTGQNKYITAKSAVAGYTRSLAKEVVRDNIQVNLIVPGMTETDLLSSLPSELIRRMGTERDYGRNLAPIEVALSMLYLSSGWSDAITGQQIVLNLGEPPFA